MGVQQASGAADAPTWLYGGALLDDASGTFVGPLSVLE